MADPSLELRKALTTRYRYGANMVDIAWRARFRCEYCDKDLLRSVDDYEWNWEVDHLVPRSRGGDDLALNWALACRTCNQFKGDWDPRDGTGDGEGRDTLLASARAYIQRRRAERSIELEQVRTLVLGELEAVDSEALPVRPR